MPGSVVIEDINNVERMGTMGALGAMMHVVSTVQCHVAIRLQSTDIWHLP